MHVYAITSALDFAWEPSNWMLEAIIGAVFGALIVPMFRVIRYIVKLFKPHPLCGKWYTYHYTFIQGEMMMLGGLYRISQNLSGLSVKADNLAPTPEGRLERKTVSYRGTVERERDGRHYIMDLSGKKHPERLVIRFAERIPPHDNILPALWLAYDHDHHVAAGVQLFCQERLSEADAEARLRSWITVGDGAMRLREAPSASPPRSSEYATIDRAI